MIYFMLYVLYHNENIWKKRMKHMLIHAVARVNLENVLK